MILFVAMGCGASSTTTAGQGHYNQGYPHQGQPQQGYAATNTKPQASVQPMPMRRLPVSFLMTTVSKLVPTLSLAILIINFCSLKFIKTNISKYQPSVIR